MNDEYPHKSSSSNPFRNVEPSEMVEKWIRDEATGLETFYSEIMGCRVTVEMPHRYQRTGGLYHIRIDLTVPVGELVIKRQPNLSAHTRQMGETEMTKHLEVNAPHKDLRVSVNDGSNAATAACGIMPVARVEMYRLTRPFQ